MKYFFSAALAMMFLGSTQAQNSDWIEEMQDPNVNFYQVQQSFNSFWEGREIEKGKGWKQFKRWEAFTEERVYPDGARPEASILSTEFAKVQQQQQSSSNSNLGQWQAKGPFNGNPLGGVGRVNRVIFHPSNSQTVYACTPAGGLWKSTDGGSTWSTNTDLLPNLGVSDLAINPNNPQIMYLATGDRDAGDTYSYGVLKSTDGGTTWNPTGLTHNVTQQIRISDLYINPVNSNVVIASTRSGIFRTTDAGASWTSVQSGIFNEIVQQPGNPNVLFVSSIIFNSSDVYKSINNGLTWTQISNAGLPATGARRIELAVSKDDSTYVYALLANGSNGFLGLYRSTDAGVSWTQRSSTPNLLGWSTTGSDNGGQAWYDLALAVNPTNKNQVYVGGVNIWRSSNGGSSWSLNGHWFGGGGAPYVHADIHHLTFTPSGSSIYSGNDGGVYRRNDGGSSWTSLNNGMNITQYYRISAEGVDTNIVIAGAQDNGTHLLDNTWADVLGGDGMDCALDPSNPNVMYGSSQYGNFRKSSNRGASFTASFGIPNNVRGTGAWVTPIRVDPQHPDTLYIGYTRVYRSFNAGVTFTPVSPSNLTGGSDIDQIAISPSQSNVVYIAEGNNLWRSDNYASSFTNLSSNVVSSRTITQITVSPDDPLHVFITHSGYTSNQKIYESFDGGLTWTNLSLNLPNVPANTIAIQDNMGLYVGTDLGVFYKDANLSQWVPFNAGLPNVVVNDLEINYHDRKLKAGTYGRGVWQSPLYSDIVAPVAGIILPHAVCDGDTVTLKNNSSYTPTNWAWNISPNNVTYVNGTNQNSPNPQVTFTQSGIYNVSLTVSNSIGSTTTNIISGIAIGGFPLPFIEDFEATTSLDKWNIENPSPENWHRFTVGGSSPGTTALKADLFYNPDGPYSIVTPNLDFRGHDSTKLSFDYAYSGRIATSGDSLKVYIATNCSDNWTLLQAYGEDGSNNFITQNPTNFIFAPTSSADWCGNSGFGNCGEIDLSAYTNTEGVRIRFEAVSGNGNNMYLDNIQITGNPNTAPAAGFSGVQNACALTPINFMDQSYGSPSAYEWTFTGGTPAASTIKNPSIAYALAGTYAVKLKVTNALGTDSITKTSYVTIDPADSVSAILTASAMPICASDSLKVSAATLNAGTNATFEWYLNGVRVYSGANSSYDFTSLSNGDEIYLSLLSSEACAYPQQLISDTIIASVYTAVPVQITAPASLCTSDTPVTLTANPVGGVFSGFAVTGSSFDPSVAGAGNHILLYEYTDANGCANSSQVTINVSTPIPITLNSIPDVCEGANAFFLNFAQPAGGTFSGTGIRSNFFFPDSAGVGVHNVTYTFSSGGCASTSKSTTLTVRANPVKPVISVQGNSLVSTATAQTYQWFRNGNSLVGANAVTYTPTISGTYTVEAIDPAGCRTISDDFIFSGIGLDELNNALSFELFPNPATNEITIKLETQTAPDANLVIFNTIGQLVFTKSMEKSTKLTDKIDISNLPSGVYVLAIEGNNIKVRKTFIVE